jgi:hypothetical protein
MFEIVDLLFIDFFLFEKFLFVLHDDSVEILVFFFKFSHFRYDVRPRTGSHALQQSIVLGSQFCIDSL